MPLSCMATIESDIVYITKLKIGTIVKTQKVSTWIFFQGQTDLFFKATRSNLVYNIITKKDVVRYCEICVCDVPMTLSYFCHGQYISLHSLMSL